MKKILAFVFVLLVLKGSAQTDSIPSFVRDSLDIYVNRALTEWQIPGVSVGIVKNGKVVLLKG